MVQGFDLTYNSFAKWNRGGLAVLAPHAVGGPVIFFKQENGVSLFAAKQALRLRYFVVQSLPGVVISISVKDRNNDKLELVDQASDLLVLAISSNELLSNIRDNGRSNPFYRSQYMFGEYFFLVSGVFVWWDACGQIPTGQPHHSKYKQDR